jgi:hypothetical protein
VLALYIIAGILLVIALGLAIPVDLVFDFKTSGGGKAVLRVEWLFGLVGKRLLPRKKPEKPAKVKKPKKDKRRDLRSVLSYTALVRARGVVPAFIKLVRRMAGSFHIHQLNVDLRLGLDDPADTGIVFGVLWPVFTLPVTLGFTTLRMNPVFDGLTFEVAFAGKVRVFPAEIMTHVLRFVFSLAGLRLIKAMAVLQWKKRK